MSDIEFDVTYSISAETVTKDELDQKRDGCDNGWDDAVLRHDEGSSYLLFRTDAHAVDEQLQEAKDWLYSQLT